VSDAATTATTGTGRSAPRGSRRRPGRAGGRSWAGLVLGEGLNALILGFLLTAAAIVLVARTPLEERGLPASAPVVIVLDAAARFDLGVRLIREGRSDWIHFSAGEGQRIARLYAERARPLLPDAVITTEDRSLTTLQNAYFTAQVLGAIPPGSILVTHPVHLLRAWLCFRWAGAEHLHLAPAERFEALPPEGRRKDVLRETVGLWLTAGRMLAFAALSRLGHGPEDMEWILAFRPSALGAR
jgi:uncharacterized SAM-binding protein YcdF (DUF218 family)